MKKKLLLSILLVTLLFSVVGCKRVVIKEKKTKKEEIVLEKDEYSVSQGETININEELSITLTNVDDSRCPEDVECFWQGELAYSLVINDNNYKLSTVLNKTVISGDYMFVISEEKCDTNTVTFKVEKIK